LFYVFHLYYFCDSTSFHICITSTLSPFCKEFIWLALQLRSMMLSSSFVNIVLDRNFEFVIHGQVDLWRRYAK
jgi:hypothetical protein